MEKEQKQELGWRVSVLPIPAFHCTLCTCNSGGMQEWVIQIPSILILVSVLFPSLHLKYFRIKFLLLVCVVFMRVYIYVYIYIYLQVWPRAPGEPPSTVRGSAR